MRRRRTNRPCTAPRPGPLQPRQLVLRRCGPKNPKLTDSDESADTDLRQWPGGTDTQEYRRSQHDDQERGHDGSRRDPALPDFDLSLVSAGGDVAAIRARLEMGGIPHRRSEAAARCDGRFELPSAHNGRVRGDVWRISRSLSCSAEGGDRPDSAVGVVRDRGSISGASECVTCRTYVTTCMALAASEMITTRGRECSSSV